MQKYVKIAFKARYLDYIFDHGKIRCENPGCKRLAVDVDHIEGRLGDKLNDVYNLIFLCRECHMKFKDKEHKVIFLNRVKQILKYCELYKKYIYNLNL